MPLKKRALFGLLWGVLLSFAGRSCAAPPSSCVPTVSAIPADHQERSATVILGWEPTGASWAMTLNPVGRQSFSTTTVNGYVCAVMSRPKEEACFDWHIGVNDKLWCDHPGEGELVVEAVATGSPIRWLVMDSALFGRYHLSDPLLQCDTAQDPTLGQLFTRHETLENGLTRTTFRLSNIRFANRILGGNDFLLHSDQPDFIALHRLTLTLRPTQPLTGSFSLSLSDLVHQSYKTFLQRSPTPEELKAITVSFQAGTLDMRSFLGNLLKNREFLERHVLPQERPVAARNLYVLACGRRPSLQELNAFCHGTNYPNLDFGLRVFLERCYPEIIAHLFRQLMKQKP